jgi:hypothetical protein
MLLETFQIDYLMCSYFFTFKFSLLTGYIYIYTHTHTHTHTHIYIYICPMDSKSNMVVHSYMNFKYLVKKTR